MKQALITVLAFLLVGSALGQSPTKIRVTTWNLEWFPNGSPHDAPPEIQAQRIEAAADVLKKLDPDILLLQEMRDYDACVRLGEAIRPGLYQIAICSAFKGAKQQEAIIAKIPTQAGKTGVRHQFLIDESHFRRNSGSSSTPRRECASPSYHTPHPSVLRNNFRW
jgi:hypothetical protein